MKTNSKIRFLLALPAACLLLAACTGDDAPTTGYNPAEGEGNAIRFTATIDGNAPGTRVAINETDGKGSFETGDEIGVWACETNSQGSYIAYSNPISATYNTSSFEAAGLTWSGFNLPLYFVATYPKIDRTDSADYTTCTVATDQSKDGAYEASDFLMAADSRYTEIPADGIVALDFRHALARVKITLVQGKGLTDEEFATAAVVIKDVHVGYKVYKKGYISDVHAGETTTNIIPKESADKTDGRTFYAVLPPQTLTDDGIRFVITVAGQQNPIGFSVKNEDKIDANKLFAGYEYPFFVNLTNVP